MSRFHWREDQKFMRNEGKYLIFEFIKVQLLITDGWMDGWKYEISGNAFIFSKTLKLPDGF